MSVEVIVKYVDNLDFVGNEFPGTKVAELYNRYAVLTIPQEYLQRLASHPHIVYVEFPKRLFYNLSHSNFR